MLLRSNSCVMDIHFLMYQVVQSCRLVVSLNSVSLCPSSQALHHGHRTRTNSSKIKTLTERFLQQAWQGICDRAIGYVRRQRFIFSGEFVLWQKIPLAPVKG